MTATDRERQILAWITQNPMISQNELAELCGITRSGVAAHISNLIRKGYLLGKGYIVASPRYVVTIGVANMDIYGESDRPVIPGSSNAGRITCVPGGVARNVSYDLCRLGVTSYLIAVYGDDHNGELIKADAAANGIDITFAKQLAHTATSSYLSIGGPDGKRAIALDDMRTGSAITPAFLEERQNVLSNAQCIAFDTSFGAESIAWLCEHVDAPLYACAPSVNRAHLLAPWLKRMDTLVLSSVEAGALCGDCPHDEKSADCCADWLLNQGVRCVFLLADGVGMLYRDADGGRWFRAVDRSSHGHFSGADSAALAALIWAAGRKLPFDERAVCAGEAAALTEECIGPVNPKLSEHVLMTRAGLLAE